MTDFQPEIAAVDALARADAVMRAKLETVVDLAVRLVRGCDHASVALLLEGRSATAAVTDHVALEVDLVQYRSGEGPCLDAVDGSGQIIRIDLLDNLSEYRRFAPGALEIGVNSVLSIPLYDGERLIGSLNLYSEGLQAFDDSSPSEAEPFAAIAADAVITAPVLPAARELLASVVERMEDDAIINQATGLIVQQRGCTPEDAAHALDELAASRGGSRRATAVAILGNPSLAAPPG